MNSEINNFDKKYEKFVLNHKLNSNNKFNNNLAEIKKDNCNITCYLPNLKVICKKLFCL